ncbi:MAG: hypothetical protein LKG79_01400 [Furfurilactobacillus sp.]|jgi:hypothetical protein|uniref:DUF4811 domain-containing protein n=1 Tax=Furfurilactobacillus milii TaxID=2888272 RepID=A0ABT6D9D9_9LACO|nr:MULTISPECIES: hypothetical protein [Furfurilactobacillus]QLE66479.1 hypothetical protein LROSL2_1129 [Furfurilactobacillus rossiae]MCF6159935.1 hypothetical protein [Furfurilactobacillus milii]MCF6162516.1 hypothetical protein [Furfurilactobacillus milii]MCF6419313.1 hypothetical protein [Furfurilactobacillus milii]MCH4010811.1 hypothetical protein [Furfurilactobacillus sp.]
MNTQANQFYKEPWFGIVLTIIFFPAGIYVMFRFGPWQKRTKTILAIVLSLVCIVVWTIAGMAPASSNPGVGETWLSTSKGKPAINVSTKLHFNVDNKGRVQLKGSTNLPDQTKLHVTISRGDTIVGDDVTVKSQAWSTNALTHNNQPLTPATYKVHITSKGWSTQPKTVTAKVGTQGQQLRGHEVTKTGKQRSVDILKTVSYQP